MRAWNVGRTDNEIIVVKPQAASTTTQMHVVLNWFDELKSRVPAR